MFTTQHQLFSAFVNGYVFQHARGVLNFADSLHHRLFQSDGEFHLASLPQWLMFITQP
jgi:hypothetical protein